jgi:hypothetical protein
MFDLPVWLWVFVAGAGGGAFAAVLGSWLAPATHKIALGSLRVEAGSASTARELFLAVFEARVKEHRLNLRLARELDAAEEDDEPRSDSSASAHRAAMRARKDERKDERK